MKIEDLFDYTFRWRSTRALRKSSKDVNPRPIRYPKFEISLKQKKSSNALRSDGMPFSTATREYFAHHIEDESLVDTVYEFRRTLLNMKTCLELFRQRKCILQEDFECVLLWLEEREKLGVTNQLAAMKTPEVLEKVRKSNFRTAPARAVKLSQNWKDPEKRERYIANMTKPEVVEARVKKFKQYLEENWDEFMEAINDPGRCEKLSKSATKMWKTCSEEKRERMRPRPSSRVHEVNGVKMNSLEAKLARRLNERAIRWQYEKRVELAGRAAYPDFYLVDYNAIIECYGDFWHANPSKYAAEDILFEDVTANDLWGKDCKKFEEFETLEIPAIAIWEDELEDVNIVDSKIDEIIERSSFIVEETTLAALAELEFKTRDFSTPRVLEFENEIEILSCDEKQNPKYSLLTNFVIKDTVALHYILGELKGSSSHRVLHDGEWTELKNHPDAILVESPISIVDVSVPETEMYIANGQINHNTTPGGLAIPFHASTRIQLIGGSKIVGKNDELIGINVEAKLIKNKVAQPFRRAEFQIIFGVGVKDHEETFDVLRAHCADHGPVEVKGKFVSVSGTGGWKLFSVSASKADHEAEKFSLEKKFQKSTFNELWVDDKYKEYLDDMLEVVMVKTPQQAERDIKKEALENLDDASDIQTP